jgi:amino-acid N-acetyltransferase
MLRRGQSLRRGLRTGMASRALEITGNPERAAAERLLAAADLPTSDLTESLLQDFFYAGSAAEPTGLVGLELQGEVALLRSLVVAPALRSRGAGTSLVEHAERHARLRGVRDLYHLTMTAEGFFARRGYTRVAREDAPQSIRSTREFAGICPASAAFMVKRL